MKTLKQFFLAFLITASFSASACLAPVENKLLEIINQFRATQNLNPLKLNDQLIDAARNHAEWMLGADRCIHFQTRYGVPVNTAPQRIKYAGFNGTLVGENVACGNEDAGKTFLQWIYSYDHLMALMNPNYEFIGIARAGDASQVGMKRCPYYWDNTFGTYKTNLDNSWTMPE